MSETPCRRIEGMTEAEKRAYVIADNKLALSAGWARNVRRFRITVLDFR
jgi:hypothetical protein